MNAYSRRVQAGRPDNSSDVSGRGGSGRRGGRARLLSFVALFTVVAGVLPVAPAHSASITSTSFSGEGVDVNGTRYAKSSHVLALTVATSSSTKCVDVTGFTKQTISGNQTKTSWTFSPVTVPANAADGVRTLTVKAGEASNSNGCTNHVATVDAAYIVDNTAPRLLPSDANKTGVSPAANVAGWHNRDVTITWAAQDGIGSGIGSGPTPGTSSVTENTPRTGVIMSATATDRLGTQGTGTVTIKLDETAPTITGSRTPLGNEFGWNSTDVTASFVCSDALSGVNGACPGPTTFANDGAGQSVSGSVQDNADNTGSATVSGINIDKTAPTLSGVPAGAGNALGWRNSDVTVNWSCSDQTGLSGINGSCPAPSTISSEGHDRTATESVSDRAGNTTSATSSPAVNIDKTAPTTGVTAPTSWNNVDVTVQLLPDDNLSGVKSTHYRLDGGLPQTGTSVSVSSEGVHTLEYWSVDNADNNEQHRIIEVKIDKTPPSIQASPSPAPNANQWNNTAVTVTFTCEDGASGVASCTADGEAGASRTVSIEGRHQVTGTARDNAGNTAAGRANVNIDTTAPTISAARDRDPVNGWYRNDVRVSFTCTDVLSGIVAGAAGCTPTRTVREGENQSVIGTATDAAGNSSQATDGGISVDKTAPELSGAPITAHNGSGWYAGNVTIRWTASDALSGLAGLPTDDVLTGEGSNVCASKTVTDVAGNSTTATLCVAIDRTPPTTLVSVPDPLLSGWYAGPVQVTLTASDPLSGVAATHYSVDGGAAQSYSGSFAFSQRGIHTIRFWSTDRAGHVEDANAPGHAVTLKIDGVPPTIEGSRSPDGNGFGWNNTPVTAEFVCSDAESGIASCTSPVPVRNEGAGQSVGGHAVDNAGNTASTTVGGINIDLTPPGLGGAPTTDANGAGWYKGDVAIAWSGSDALSGIDPATQPANSIITDEGRTLGAGPVSISDKAGNTTSASVSGIKIDRGRPSITPVRPAANGDGWYNTAVSIGFVCADPALADGTAGSSVAACPSDKQVTTNGANQSVTSDPATDMAGNQTSGISVGGINVDALPPQSSANNDCTPKNGWCRGATVKVVITGDDQPGLSGVREIRYSVNGAPERSTAGSTATAEVALNGTGEANVRYYAVDRAGNAENPNAIALKYDNIAPMVTNTVTPAANGAGWHRTDAAVTFTAKDDDNGSGVDMSTVPAPRTLTDETAGTAVTATISDLAGNETTDSVTVKIDKTVPTINGTIVSGALGSNGWYTGPVTVRFTCADPNGAAPSGIATGACPDDVTISTNGANQSVTRSVSDRAGNSASATVSGINIDGEVPTVSVAGVAAGTGYTLGAVPQATCAATDDVSTVASCNVSTPAGGLPNGVGTFTVTATATDRAGNSSTATISYRVEYKWTGFSQPINDPEIDPTFKLSVFKAGSTVPAKFQLRRADGTIVQANTLPSWATPQKGSAITAPVDENLYSDPASSGTTYRWDSTAQQYIYNYGTAKNLGGSHWRIGVRLDDGTSHIVDIGLRS